MNDLLKVWVNYKRRNDLSEDDRLLVDDIESLIIENEKLIKRKERMSERKLFAYLVIEQMLTGHLLEHEIYAPNDGVALEFIRKNLRGEIVSFTRKEKEVYILDYVDLSKDSEDTAWEVKYITINFKEELKEGNNVQ